VDEPLELALEEQQDYDVADLVKQFFRELPEALMTTKLSDTFLAIFQRKILFLFLGAFSAFSIFSIRFYFPTK